MANVDMSGVFRGRVVVRQVDAGLVVFIDQDWALDILARDRFNHVNDPEQQAGDI